MRPAMLTLARESRGLTQSKLAARIGISQGHLSKFEAGLTPVPEHLAERIVNVLRYPPPFFDLPDPVFGPGTSEFFHRKRQALSGKTLNQLHARINVRRIQLARLLRSVELDADRIPELDPDNFDGSASEVARAVRAAWNVPRGPLEDLTATIEESGGIVIPCDFGTPFLEAVSRWVPGMPPLFFVNQDAPGDRARLTLAHELGHMVMHHVARADMEEQAFEFAAEFLMPEREIRTQLDGLTLDRLIALKLHWKVSMQAILKRAETLGRIGPGKARYLWSQLSKAGYRLREPSEADIPRETPRQLDEILRIYRQFFAYTPEQLAELVALNPEEFTMLYGDDSPRPRLRLLRNSPQTT